MFSGDIWVKTPFWCFGGALAEARLGPGGDQTPHSPMGLCGLDENTTIGIVARDGLAKGF